MNTPRFPLAYLGNIDYYSKLLSCERVLFEAEENYPKQTIRNRCVIFGANGPIKLSIPVLRTSGQKQRIKDVKINYREDWQKDHWRGITSAYNASPYFEFYVDGLEPFFQQKPEFLFDLTLPLHEWILEQLQHTFASKFTETFEHQVEGLDFRSYFSSNKAQLENPSEYLQVFSDKHGFQPNLSVIDLLFNEGPNALNFLQS